MSDGSFERSLLHDEQMRTEFVRQDIAMEYKRPCVIYKPALTVSDGRWCAMYPGDGTGVAGYGNSPAAAMADFDKAWVEPICDSAAWGRP